MMVDAPGIYQITEEEYHSANVCIKPCFSSGVCKDILNKSPLHAWTNHPALNPDYKEEPDDKFDIGKAGHSLFLEGIDNATVIEADNWMKKETKQARADARAEGRIPLLREQYERVKTMVEIANQTIALSDVHMAGWLSERSIFWTEDETWCKIRPDAIAPDLSAVLHYKTSRVSVNPATIDRLVLNMDYDIAEALYRRGVKAVTGKEPSSVFFFQETEPPYACSLIDLPPQWMETLGDDRIKMGLWIWQKCMATGVWPGYPLKVCTIDTPAYALAAWEMKRFALELLYKEEDL
jgi:hypothetical protein